MERNLRKTRVGKVVSNKMAVSYTHLDVYKRQALQFALYTKLGNAPTKRMYI